VASRFGRRIARQKASFGENQSLTRRKSHLKGGCSQDWLPHKACEITVPPPNEKSYH
jgi:hypothetical protein